MIFYSITILKKNVLPYTYPIKNISILLGSNFESNNTFYHVCLEQNEADVFVLNLAEKHHHVGHIVQLEKCAEVQEGQD